MISKKELVELSNIDFDNVDISTLKELTEIKIDKNANIEEKFDLFINQIGNPYMFTINKTPVKISFSEHTDRTLNDCLYQYFSIKR